jgi:predicted AlkP superfamily pyrophosphatase or phosphodiesterase
VALALIALTFCGSASSQRRSPKPRGSEHPRLVLQIVIDQFRYDYLKRFSEFYGPGGFNRLLRSGASWENCNYDYLVTKTAPGHSAIATGAPPSATGMVGNEWLERSPAIKVTSVTDASAKILNGGVNEIASSPLRLLASTVGDELRLATNNRAKVVGLSDKPRASILATGRRANGAYWFNSYSGGFASSDYYFPELPAWVVDYNQTHPADKYFRAKGEKLLPEREYLRLAGPDSPPWEKVNVKTDTNAFPHTITGGAERPNRAFYDALDQTPFLNELLVSFAEAAIPGEQLGQDSDTDLLSVSLSGNDHVGHRFGPYSQEVMDMAIRTDQMIAGLLDFVDAKVGLSKTIVVLTGDHGVSPIIEHAAALNLGGRRISQKEIMTAVRTAISRRYNPNHKSPDPTADYIMKYSEGGQMKEGFLNGSIYFDFPTLERDGVSLEEIARVAGEGALTVPGIARYFTRGQLQNGCSKSVTSDSEGNGSNRKSPVVDNVFVSHRGAAISKQAAAKEIAAMQPHSTGSQCDGVDDPIFRMARRAFYAGRSGDLVLVADAFKVLGDSADAANHGSPYSYDTHVPLILMGPGIRHGRHFQPATPMDIAPTLANLLGIQQPSNASGRILLEALTSP